MVLLFTGVLLLVATLATTSAASTDLVTSIEVGLPHRDPASLERLFWQVSDPQSPSYLAYPTLPELRALIGASESDLDAVSAWLLALGADSVERGELGDSVTGTFARDAPSLLGATARPFRFDYVLTRRGAGSGAAEGGLPIPPKQAPVRAAPSAGLLSTYTIAKQKAAYGIPETLAATHANTTAMVWGPGTFGYSPSKLALHKAMQCPLLNLEKVVFDTENHGTSGGDNWGEGNLDVTMIASFGLNATISVSNTNTSTSTEESDGFGAALLAFLTSLSSRAQLPSVLSMSLGSLSSYSCDLLCTEAAKAGHTQAECRTFMESQRQVCMFISPEQDARISSALQVLGLRGVTVLGSSGDGGSHFSFQPYPSDGGGIADALNNISCANMLPVYPTASPYLLSIGGTQWKGGDSSIPVAWVGTGGGFAGAFEAPAHQKSVVAGYLGKTAGLPSSGSFAPGNRAYPDFSAVGVEGTSQSCPIAAGIMTLIADHRLNAGLPALGFVAPRLWAAASAKPGVLFTDVTEGNSRQTCRGEFCPEGFPAGPGWDPVTGWGRPNWDGLLAALGSD